MTTEAEIGGMQPQVTERQQPPELREARMYSSLEHPWEISPGEKKENLDFGPANAGFGLLGSRALREYVSVVLGHPPSLREFVRGLRKPTQGLIFNLLETDPRFHLSTSRDSSYRQKYCGNSIEDHICFICVEMTK